MSPPTNPTPTQPGPRSRRGKRIPILLAWSDSTGQAEFARRVEEDRLPYLCRMADSLKAARDCLSDCDCRIVVCELGLRDGTAFDFLRSASCGPSVIVIGVDDRDIAVSAMKAGAADYLVKDEEGRWLEALPRALAEAVETLGRGKPSHGDDAMDRRRLEARLKAGGTRFRLINQELNWLRFAIDEHALVSTTDITGKILFVNPRFCQTSKYSKRELLGNDHRIVNSGYHSKAFFHRMWSTLLRGEVWRGEIRNRAKDGSYYWVNTTIIPFRNVGGELTQFTSIRMDVTQQKLASLELAKAKEAAENAARVKSEFLANMSHEIRTPINGILGTAEMLRRTGLNDEQDGIAAFLVSSADILLSLVDDILDFSKIEAGMMALDQVPFSPLATVMEVAGLLDARTRAKGLELIVDAPPCLPSRLMGDPVRIKQVLFNLLGNAIKFTDFGHVMLSLDSRPTGDGKAVLEFSVRDSGIGIPSDALGTLFEKFTQGDASTTRRFGGTGLGLAISKRLVQLMGGNLEVESLPGAGSVFRFEIAFGPPPGMALVPPPEIPLRGKRVLLVDSGRQAIRVLAERLARHGARQEMASSLADAASRLESAAASGDPFHFTVAGHEISLAESEAWAADLGARGTSPGARLIALCEADTCGKHDRLAKAGLAACLSGPLCTSEILQAMALAIAAEAAGTTPPLITRRHLGRIPEPCGGAPVIPAPEVVMRFPRPYHILHVEDNPVNEMIVSRMLKEFGCTYDVARNGREALDLVFQNHYDLILMDCHMPVMDGWETTRRIRRSGPAQRRMPVIALTADAMEGDRERCLEAGMDDYLTKPIRAKALWEMLSKSLLARD